VSDETHLQVTKLGESLILSSERSSLIARGRRDAELLSSPTDPLLRVRQLAGEGDMHAQCELGEAYYEGHGVPRDYVEALVWFRKAADQVHLYANMYLSHMYERGEGVPSDRSEAVRYYFRAADIALASSQSDDLNGWDPDWILEAERQAAEHGHADAQYVVGLMYRDGGPRGYTKDYIQAHMWFSLAGANGDSLAVQQRDLVARKMTPGQIAEAQRLAREWKPKPSH